MLSAAALWVQYSSRRAERDNPPQGRFVEVNGARLHYVEFGRGEPLVLFHGQGSMIQDFVISGLVGLAAKDYRVIVFDRPGYGYSDRPRGTIWTPAAQAALFNAALAQLGVFRTIILGHSWGASVAVAYALQYRDAARALVLVSGYYYPTLRADVAVQSGQAVPMVGDLLRYTVSPLVGRMAWPRLTRKIFEPAPVPAKFALFPVAMALRPGSLQASAAEAALMIPDAAALKPHYPELRMPVAIVAGEGDEVVPTERHSARLHREIPQSTFHALPGAGHMIHHSAPGYVLGAIHEAASASRKVEAEASVQDNIAA
jgi:pimeloyl-ACP methyl ester carboxylesterase